MSFVLPEDHNVTWNGEVSVYIIILQRVVIWLLCHLKWWLSQH